MMADPTPTSSHDPDADCELRAANDAGETATVKVHRQILTIARAIGRQMAREHLKSLLPANDNDPEDQP